jgi:hypothetical protein
LKSQRFIDPAFLPQFPSHPGIQESLGRQDVPVNDIDQISSTGTRRGRKALADSGPAPRREDLQVDITSSQTVKEQLTTTGNHLINYFIEIPFN